MKKECKKIERMNSHCRCKRVQKNAKIYLGGCTSVRVVDEHYIIWINEYVTVNCIIITIQLTVKWNRHTFSGITNQCSADKITLKRFQNIHRLDLVDKSDSYISLGSNFRPICRRRRDKPRTNPTYPVAKFIGHDQVRTWRATAGKYWHLAADLHRILPSMSSERFCQKWNCLCRLRKVSLCKYDVICWWYHQNMQQLTCFPWFLGI
jgi:hypothetical protein